MCYYYRIMKILVIEDEHKIAQSIKKGLEHELFVVDIAYTGSDGYDLAASEPYDLIILDSMLPEMSGPEICKALRKHNIHTPVLMLTAKGQVDDRVEGLNAGADDYLVKPFAFSELVARVHALLRRPHTTMDTILTFADLKMDITHHTVTRGGKPIKLSRKEYALLEYLMRNQNKIVTKDDILYNVWDYDADILPNTVEVYMSYLRKKVDDQFHASPLIRTVRGFGYKLGEDT